MKERFKNIDILRGICIVYMILGHIPLSTSFDHYIHAFHMPIFFLISGFFLKRNSNVNFIVFLKKMLRKYILPYIVFSFIYYFLSCTIKFDFVGYKETFISFFKTNDIFLPIGGALWFLTSFFFCQLIIYFINKYIKKDYIFIIICILIGTFGVYINNILPFRLWWSISSSLVGVGLVCIGHFINKYNILYKISFNFKSIIDILLTILLFIINYIFIIKSGYVNMRLSTYPNVIIFVINLLMSLVVYINISNILIKYKFFNFITKILSFIGEKSIIFLCINQFVIVLLNKFLININIILLKKTILSVFSLIIIYFIAKVISRTKIKYIFGFKKE